MNDNFELLIQLYQKCTGNNNVKSIENILSEAPFFEEIKEGTNYCYNYEGYISNLLDLTNWIKTNCKNYPKELDQINPEWIKEINNGNKCNN